MVVLAKARIRCSLAASIHQSETHHSASERAAIPMATSRCFLIPSQKCRYRACVRGVTDRHVRSGYHSSHGDNLRQNKQTGGP